MKLIVSLRLLFIAITLTKAKVEIHPGPDNGCEKGWTRIGDNTCFIYFPEVKKNWRDAQKFCSKLGARLFESPGWSIDKRVRAWFIGEIVTGSGSWKEKRQMSPWVGLNDIKKEGR